jgi:hypothetical protein
MSRLIDAHWNGFAFLEDSMSSFYESATIMSLG